eukprot:m.3908 g.3908  ORF g.3908 m.3908 type:complete len:153 (+) comp2144_c0_seq1:37-495(+)
MSEVAKCTECHNLLEGLRFCTNCGKENMDWVKPDLADETDLHQRTIFRRTLYPYCILSCLFCSPNKIHITNKRIDTQSGWCYGNEDTLDLRRVKDIGFRRSFFQMCINRGTIVIFAADSTNPEMKISCFGGKRVFNELRTTWNQTKLGTVVE